MFSSQGFNFGTQQTTNPTQNTSQGLFGAKPQTTPTLSLGQPNQLNLFGQQQSTPQQNTFGQQPSTNTTQNTNTGMFGNQASNTNLFGQTTNQTGLFGQQSQQNMFGQSSNQPTLFGQSQLQTNTGQQINPLGQLQNTSTQNLTPETKYNDLSDEFQKELDEFNKKVQKQRHLAESLDTSYTSTLVHNNEDKLNSLQKKFSTVRDLLNRDLVIINQLRDNVLEQMNNEETSIRIFEEMMKNGGPGTLRSTERPFYSQQDFIWNFFLKLSKDLESKIEVLNKKLEDFDIQIQQYSSGNNIKDPNIVNQILKNNYDAYTTLSAKVSEIHEGIMNYRIELKKNSTKNLLPNNVMKNIDFMDIASRIASTPSQNNLNK